MTWQYKENESGRYLQKVGNGSHDEISLNSDEECGSFLADLMNKFEAFDKVNRKQVFETTCVWIANSFGDAKPVDFTKIESLKPLIGKRTKVRIVVE